MRPRTRGWQLGGGYSGAARRLLFTHASHQLAELSYLLRDPRQFPVVIVTGRSFSACTALYRALPTVVYTAYNSETMSGQTPVLSPANPAGLPRPSSLRLVSHTSALLGPEVCEKTDAYVEVIRAAEESVGAADAEPLLNAEDRDDALSSETESVWLNMEYEERLRHNTTSIFTEQFLSLVEDRWRSPTARAPRREAASGQPAGKADSRLLRHGLLHDGELRGVGCGSIVWHRDVQREARPYHIHWVVPRWLTGSKADVPKMIDAWRSVLSHSRSGEVVSLVLFVNVDALNSASVLRGFESNSWKTGRKVNTQTDHGMNMYHAPPPSHGCTRCSAVWYPLTLRLQLRAALLPLHAQLNTLADFSSAYAPSAERTDIGTPVRGFGTESGGAANPPPRTVRLMVPVVNCWDAWNSAPMSEILYRTLLRTAKAFGQLSSALGRNQPEHRRRERLLLDCLKEIPGPLRQWQWLLQENSFPYAVPLPGAQLPHTFPYMVVKGREDQRQERQRALRRNAVDAETLRRLNAEALSAGFSAAGGPPTSAPLPSPRYFTTLVSDAGSLLARDGCLTDLFVVEFQPALREADVNSPLWHCMRAGTSGDITLSSLDRNRARLELLSAAKRFVATAIPSASLTCHILKCATQFLCSSGRGRGVLAWPLMDPAEGGHCLRVAFTLSYEFHADPSPVLQRLRKGSRAGGAGKTKMHGTAPSGGLASFTPPTAAGSENSQLLFVVLTVKDVIRYILRDMRKLGWVLVWQENHHRWPTAVPPPHMHPDMNTSHSPSSLRRSYRAGLQARVAASLERWRQEQFRCHKKRYDADASAWALKVPSSKELVEAPKEAAQGAVAASPYTSLDVWQAALIPEDAGVYLWEGQTVFLDDGRRGVIVEFRPPPAELFTSFQHHPTEAKRMHWRMQQRRYSDFIRFYRWRRHIRAAVHPRRIAAAFTGLPHYVREREMTHFPVVELLDGSTGGKRPRVHVLPIRAVRSRVAYPRVCVVSVAEQRDWLEAQGRPVFTGDEFRDEVWQLPSRESDGRSSSEVTLLRLPLSPFRIDDVASLFVSRVMNFSKEPLNHRAQHALCGRPLTGTSVTSLRCLNAKWACHHRHSVAKGDLAAERVRAAHQRGQINWSSFAAHPESIAGLCYVLDPALDNRSLR
ncbi:hypothetical protein GH5_03040 [Leishmania sp. Ghana 2012 LV757]|uniref:hypothetical protein n=1 Tax=Leishmania sp. Ghana 2012 LV757 TaxID=2803181 RepID=UPI001B4824A8|nr:hypothetical protein GH5_03040 [Leishmania sp. Ghana 2012 LV757]